MYLENRLIAMLDVLGFANRIQTREGLLSTTEKYAKLIAQSKVHVFSPKGAPGSPNEPQSNFEFGQFVFDTVVLVSHPLDIKSTCNFVSATTLLMENFFTEEFPLRGSIAHGDFCVDASVSIFLSDAFKRLRQDEDRQQWTGCVLLPEVEEIVISAVTGVNASLPPMRSSQLHKVAIPTKILSTPPDLRWCLNWSYFLSPKVVEAGLTYMAGDPSKQENTRQYLRFLDSLPDDIQNLPAQFSPAMKLKTMKTRSGFRCRFEDSQGTAVDPGCGFTLAVNETEAAPHSGSSLQPISNGRKQL